MFRLNGSSYAPRRRGFTLIELLVAVTLLVLIILAASYILDTTSKAVGHAQVNNELNVSLEAFSQLMRDDFRGLEHDGWLVIGSRQRRGFGSPKDRADEYERTLRTDWMTFMVNREQQGNFDSRLIAQWSRVIYGHGAMSNPTAPNNSNIGTDWVLMRHKILEINKLTTAWAELEELPGSPYSGRGIFEGIEGPVTGDYIGMERQYGCAVLSYSGRGWRWYWYMNYGWSGTIPMPWGYERGSSTPMGFHEPDYWQNASVYYGSSSRRFHVLANCAEFQVQYAMDEDVIDGVVRWRNPPFPTEATYTDPNYKGTELYDPLHNTPRLMNYERGRLSFGPGDKWPKLVKIDAMIFDPMDRVDQGRKTTMILEVP